MLFLAFIALLLHPLLYFDGIRFYMDCPSYFFLHIIAYTIFGNLIWNVLKHKAWWISALAIVAGVNIILFVFLYFFVKSWDVRDALTVLVFLFDFIHLYNSKHSVCHMKPITGIMAFPPLLTCHCSLPSNLFFYSFEYQGT